MKHGTVSMYVNHRCPCSDCREAKRVYEERRRRAAGVKRRAQRKENA